MKPFGQGQGLMKPVGQVQMKAMIYNHMLMKELLSILLKFVFEYYEAIEDINQENIF